MKKAGKKLVVSILGRQVRKLRKKHPVKVIGVVGSIGKTSTKLAIAQVLGKNLRVRYQHGNYNDLITVPLIFFGHEQPGLLNVLDWLKIFLSNSRQIRGDYPYDAVVVELGTDGPGQIAQFQQYLQLDYAVVTAISPEHMEFFPDLHAVASEELSVQQFSGKVIYNADLVGGEFAGMLPEGSISYGIKNTDSSFYLSNIFYSAHGYEADIKHGGMVYLHVAHEVVSEVQLYALMAAVVVGKELGLKSTQILAGIPAITPVSGRLRRLRGINGSMIIDDTYNASPDAVKAGLDTLYKLDAPQKIAVLGSMNELGSMSPDAHRQIGEYCDPAQLNLVVTIGSEANTHLAPAAKNKGCTVQSFDNPYAAGEYLQGKIESGAIIFAKGSQNGVFAEEAVRLLLADPEDASKLVRQTDYWLAQKDKQFNRKV